MTPTLRRAAATVGVLAAGTATAAVKSAAGAASGSSSSADAGIHGVARSLRQLYHTHGSLRSQGQAAPLPVPQQEQVAEAARRTARGFAATSEPAQQSEYQGPTWQHWIHWCLQNRALCRLFPIPRSPACMRVGSCCAAVPGCPLASFHCHRRRGRGLLAAQAALPARKAGTD